MAVIKEVTISTGTMTFDTVSDLDSFVAGISALKRSVDAITLARHAGTITSLESTQVSPSSFYSKTVYPDQAAYDSVNAGVDVSGATIAFEQLGWTINRTISYTYD